MTTAIGALLACAQCGRQSAAAAKILWVDMILLAVPFALAGFGFWVFRRELGRNRATKE